MAVALKHWVTLIGLMIRDFCKTQIAQESKILNALIAEITVTSTSEHWVETLLEVECRPDPSIRSIKFLQIHRSSIWELLPGTRTIPFGDTQLVGQLFSMNRTPSSIVSPPLAEASILKTYCRTWHW